MAASFIWASTVLLLVFAVLSAVDGLYLHLWRYRLHLRADSAFEHWLHTARAVLFPGILATLFLASPRGTVLWLGLALVAVDQAVELFDTFSERASRASLGGLSSFEYSLHVTLTTLRVAALTLALAAVPSEAWALSAWEFAPVAHPAAVRSAVMLLVPGAIAVAVLHVVLGCWASPAHCRWRRVWAR